MRRRSGVPAVEICEARPHLHLPARSAGLLAFPQFLTLQFFDARRDFWQFRPRNRCEKLGARTWLAIALRDGSISPGRTGAEIPALDACGVPLGITAPPEALLNAGWPGFPESFAPRNGGVRSRCPSSFNPSEAPPLLRFIDSKIQIPA
jgi:hypothetical protein